MARKQLTNYGEDSLTAAITSGATSMTVNSGAKFPASGDYNLVLSSDSTYEVVVCTSRSTNTLTVVRGQDGTTAVAHPPGTRVVLTLTADQMLRYVADDSETVVNEIHLASHGLRDRNYNRLQLADFTWINQGSATATQYDDGSIGLVTDNGPAADNNRILEKTLGGLVAPWRVRCTIIPQLHTYNAVRSTPAVGMQLRDSTGGRIWQNAIVMHDGGATDRDRMLVRDWTAATTFSSELTDYDAPVGREFHVFEIEYAANNDVTFRSSANGYWWWAFTHNNASYTFDRVGFFAMPGANATASNNFTTIATLVSWEEWQL